MNQTSITFLGLGLTLFIWASGSALTNYIANSPAREMKVKAHAGVDTANSIDSSETIINQEIKKLTEEVSASPENQELRLKLANLCFESGIRFQKAEYLKDSVGHFHEVLVKDPNQKEALLGLGTLSLHVGVGEKAKEYYERYLTLVPDDQSAKSNLALALQRAGNTEEALVKLDEVLKKDPNFVIALVTKGLIKKETGKLNEALVLFDKAEKLEKNPVLLERISQLKQNQEVGSKSGSRNNESREESLKNYFQTHSILKNKFVSLVLLDQNLVVQLKDFPIETMPEFAKTKFIESLKKLMSEHSLKTILLKDSVTNNDLLKL